eukprot:Sspe_Gene.6298::Locus_2128_Transcript_1_1_Confidence_1.000_Length_2011::g.6298::m.6298/K14947/ESRP1_2; epithelial splicing regulatory protein 1/2
MGTPDFYVPFDVSTTGNEANPGAECEVTEMAWAVVDSRTGHVTDQHLLYVSPTVHPRPVKGPSFVLPQAIAHIDSYFREKLRGATFVLVTDGPFSLRRAVKLECTAKSIPLSAHWGQYYDIRKETMRVRPDIASSVNTLADVLAAYSISFLPSTPIERCLALAAVLRRMHMTGTLPVQRPQQVPYGDKAAMERQWRSSSPVRDNTAMHSPARGTRTCVRLRGLPFQATPADVREFFAGLPVYDDGITFLYNVQGKSKGEAFVQFPDECTAMQATSRDKQFMGERYIEVFLTTVEEMLHCLAQTNPATSHSTVVRCRGMPYSVTPEEITNFFTGCAIQEDGITICYGADGRPTGEAFVQFVEEHDTSRALKRHRSHLGGRYIEIFRSSRQEMGNQKGRAGGAAPHNKDVNGISPHVVRIRGLPDSLHEVEISSFLGTLNIKKQGIHMVYSAEGRPTGEAYVELETTMDVQHAVAKHRSIVGRRVVEIYASSPQEIMAACAMCDAAPVSRPPSPPSAPPPAISSPPPSMVQQIFVVPQYVYQAAPAPQQVLYVMNGAVVEEDVGASLEEMPYPPPLLEREACVQCSYPTPSAPPAETKATPPKKAVMVHEPYSLDSPTYLHCP